MNHRINLGKAFGITIGLYLLVVAGMGIAGLLVPLLPSRPQISETSGFPVMTMVQVDVSSPQINLPGALFGFGILFLLIFGMLYLPVKVQRFASICAGIVILGGGIYAFLRGNIF